MAHESFENDDVAKIMNENFVNIKVDREERPDLDDIYQKVCQMSTGQGGWVKRISYSDQNPSMLEHISLYLIRMVDLDLEVYVDNLLKLEKKTKRRWKFCRTVHVKSQNWNEFLKVEKLKSQS